MTMLLQGKETPFDTELFKPVMDKLHELQKIDNIQSRRIVAEHFTFKHDDYIRWGETK